MVISKCIWPYSPRMSCLTQCHCDVILLCLPSILLPFPVRTLKEWLAQSHMHRCIFSERIWAGLICKWPMCLSEGLSWGGVVTTGSSAWAIRPSLTAVILLLLDGACRVNTIRSLSLFCWFYVTEHKSQCKNIKGFLSFCLRSRVMSSLCSV